MAAGKLLPPCISTPESDAKGRNSTAVSNAQLTPTTARCQGKGRGEGETATVSFCPGARAVAGAAQEPCCPGTCPVRLGHTPAARCSCPLSLPHQKHTSSSTEAAGKPHPNEEKSQGRWKKSPCSSCCLYTRTPVAVDGHGAGAHACALLPDSKTGTSQHLPLPPSPPKHTCFVQELSTEGCY